MRLFVDTSALLALGNPSDGNHESARECFRMLSAVPFLTSDYVLDEVLARWITRGQVARGLAFIRALCASPRYTLVFVDQDVFKRTFERVAGYAKQRLSFTDCTNVVLIEDHRLDGIFAFDSGFDRVGLETFPKAPL